MSGGTPGRPASPAAWALGTYVSSGEERVGLVLGGRVYHLDLALEEWQAQAPLGGSVAGGRVSPLGVPASMLTALQRWQELEPVLGLAAAWLDAVGSADLAGSDRAPDVPSVGLTEAEFLAPVPRPGKILNFGLNFYEHAEEMGMTIPPDFVPNVFFKGSATAVVGPSQPIRLSSAYVDWEAELAVIIGRTARDVAEDSALDHVAGYTCHNDVTDRRAMLRADGSLDFIAGKARDTFAPLGPLLVPRQFVPRPEELRVRCLVNGEVRQDYPLAGMCLPLARCIAHVSSLMTLEPGDVIGLGTGAGTGWAHGAPQPRSLAGVIGNFEAGGGRFLRSGDRVAVEVEGVGLLESEVA